MKLVLAIVLLAAGFSAAQESNPKVTVAAEEDVYTYLPPDNGSGPMWSYGCTTILRLKEGVVVSQFETGVGVPKLCNTRWRLLRRQDDGWKVFAEAEGYRQREPAVLGTIDRESLLLNVNDSVMPPGTEYGRCQPYLLQIPLQEPSHMRKIEPRWAGTTDFTDHSYRGFATDAERHEILMLNINAGTSAEHWALMDAAGETVRSGEVSFPIRACYPQVALKEGAAYVLAVGDIKEPVEEWAEYKFAQSGRQWDYVFRILYFTSSPDLRGQDFGGPIEIANVDATAGHIGNQDLWIAPDGSAYILYVEREVQSAVMRDRFFPGKSIVGSLHLAVVKDGKVAERRVLAQGVEGDEPGHARFHEAADGRLFALVAFSGNRPRNELVQIHPKVEPLRFIPVPFKTPFGSFLLATVRAGNAPSNTIDLLGHNTSGTTLTYGRIDLE